MKTEKEVWEELIGIIVLIFTTYTIIKDFVDEGAFASINALINSKTFGVIISTGIFLIFVFVGLRIYIKNLKKNGKIN